MQIRPWASRSIEPGLGSPLPLPAAPFTRPQRADTKSSVATTTASSMDALDPDPVTSRILKAVTDLGNTVLAKRAAGELHAMKAKRPPQFQSVDAFQKVMRILERHHFRLPVCRFVIDLFDRKVLRRIVLEEDEDEDTSESESTSASFDAVSSGRNEQGAPRSALSNELARRADESDSSDGAS
ncbi:MAG: hypothetical protein INR71_02525 [Terriglobus roseus]|nr:hypothetical protein [Terriglobus roseus]